jgi:hypothetical protein
LIYCDSSIITDALEYKFSSSRGYGTIYPPAADGREYKPLMKGFANYWITVCSPNLGRKLLHDDKGLRDHFTE